MVRHLSRIDSFIGKHRTQLRVAVLMKRSPVPDAVASTGQDASDHLNRRSDNDHLVNLAPQSAGKSNDQPAAKINERIFHGNHCQKEMLKSHKNGQDNRWIPMVLIV